MGALDHVIDCHYCSSMDQISIDISKAAVSDDHDSRKSPADREVRNIIINNGKGGKQPFSAEEPSGVEGPVPPESPAVTARDALAELMTPQPREENVQPSQPSISNTAIKCYLEQLRDSDP